MDNKVGDNLPSDKKLSDLVTKLTSIINELEKFCVALQPGDRSGALKPPAAGEAMALKAADLATRHKVSVNNVPLQGMLNDVEYVKALRPLESLMTRGQRLLADSILQGGNEYWEAFLAYYGALGNAATHDAGLAAEAKDLQDQMRDLRKRRPQRGNGGGSGGSPTPSGGGGSGSAGPGGGTTT